MMAERHENVEKLAGPVARELLRVSRMSFSMWRDILRENAANIELELRALSSHLSTAADALRDGDVGALRHLFPSELDRM